MLMLSRPGNFLLLLIVGLFGIQIPRHSAALLLRKPIAAGGSTSARNASAAVVYLGRPPQLHVAYLGSRKTSSSSSGSAATLGDHDDEPGGNDTAWFRYRAQDEAGQAAHEHFAGLKATGDFKRDVLAAHAAVREEAGIGALGWDPDLEKVAAARAQELAAEDCQIRHMSGTDRTSRAGYEQIGENLYKAVLPPHFPEPTGVDMVDAWYAEIEDYAYGPQGWACTKRKCRDRESPPCMIGHFTQVAWADTTHVGCAVRECQAAVREGQILMSRVFVAVCHYGPAGNDVQRLPFPREAAGRLGLSSEPCARPHGR